MCEQCSGDLAREPSDRSFTRRAALAGAAAVVVGARLGAGASAAAGSPVPSVTVAPGLDIKPRSTWTSQGPKRPLSRETPKFLLVHHSASSNSYAAADIAPLLRNVFTYHTSAEKGWPDVCYNFFIDRFGGVWEGRSGSLAGPVVADATGGSQGFAQLVCLLGDFTSTMPTAAAQTSLRRLLAWLARRDGISTASGATATFVSRGSQRHPKGTTVTTATIAGHRAMSYTACPGDKFYPYVTNGLRADVQAVRAGTSDGTTGGGTTGGGSTGGGSSATTYTVRAGDSLYGIASKTNTPINTLLSLNGLTLRSVIYPGQVLKIRSSTSTGGTPEAVREAVRPVAVRRRRRTRSAPVTRCTGSRRRRTRRSTRC